MIPSVMMIRRTVALQRETGRSAEGYPWMPSGMLSSFVVNFDSLPSRVHEDVRVPEIVQYDLARKLVEVREDNR